MTAICLHLFFCRLVLWFSIRKVQSHSNRQNSTELYNEIKLLFTFIARWLNNSFWLWFDNPAHIFFGVFYGCCMSVSVCQCSIPNVSFHLMFVSSLTNLFGFCAVNFCPYQLIINYKLEGELINCWIALTNQPIFICNRFQWLLYGLPRHNMPTNMLI